MLAKTSATPLALVSRPESLAELGGTDLFRSSYVLHDAAETEDGEDDTGTAGEIGLHAKIYVYQIGNRTHIALGSPNATDAALIADRNVEILVELAGPSYKVGAVSKLFDADANEGLGQYLVNWIPEPDAVLDTGKLEGQKVLEDVRSALLAAELALSCQPAEDGWELRLEAKKMVGFQGIGTAVAWPVTVGGERAVDLRPLTVGNSVILPLQDMSSLTSLIAFKLGVGGECLSFALNIPVSGMPEGRESAILRRVVSNREGFMRYLLLLLAGLGDGADVGAVARAFTMNGSKHAKADFEDWPLLEELVRAFSREPNRLVKVQRLVDNITADGKSDEILPAGFLALWKVFGAALVNHER
jgi:hypothetical protein